MFAVMNFSIAVLSIFDVAFEHEEGQPLFVHLRTTGKTRLLLL